MKKLLTLFGVCLCAIVSSQVDSSLYYLKQDMNDSVRRERIEKYVNRILKSGEKAKAEKKLVNVISYYKEKNKVECMEYTSLLAKFYFNTGDFDKCISTEKQNIATADAAGLHAKTGYCYFNIAIGNLAKGQVNEARTASEEAVKLLKDDKRVRIYAKSIVNLGLAEFYEGHYKNAIDYYWQALKMQEANNIQVDVADSYNNMAIIYGEMDDLKNAIKYQRNALAYYQKAKTARGIAQSLGNMGTMYFKMKQTDSAIYYQELCLPLSEKLPNKIIYVNTIGSLASAYKQANNNTEFLKYNQMAIALSKETGLLAQYCQSISAYAAYLIEQKEFDKAEPLVMEALKISDEQHYGIEQRDVLECLYKIELNRNNYKKALEYQLKFQQMKESLTQEDKQKEVLRKTFEYEYTKKALADSVAHAEEKLRKDAEIEANNARLKTEKVIRYSLFMGLAIIIAFAIFIYNRLKLSQKQKQIISRQKTEVEESKMIIEKQKDLVEEKQKEIIDSINYAKRIQDALLANKSMIDAVLTNFIMFKPKDIVSGDFYWATNVTGSPFKVPGLKQETNNHELFYLAVCDSTGHGVPGAFMSLLNIGFLSEAIKEKGIYAPNEVFNYTRRRLVESISFQNQKDGFDGILVCINKTTGQITYAAANNAPLLIINGQLADLPADKMPVGKGERDEPFTLYTIDNAKGANLYLFTDGLPDQFGGPKGKKYKYKQLETLLLENHRLPFNEQEKKVEQSFNDWKGDLEQVDDVLIAGIKL